MSIVYGVGRTIRHRRIRSVGGSSNGDAQDPMGLCPSTEHPVTSTCGRYHMATEAAHIESLLFVKLFGGMSVGLAGGGAGLGSVG